MLCQKCRHCQKLNTYLAVACSKCCVTLIAPTYELTTNAGKESNTDDKDSYRVDSRTAGVDRKSTSR
jgi:hypothetical protein